MKAQAFNTTGSRHGLGPREDELAGPAVRFLKGRGVDSELAAQTRWQAREVELQAMKSRLDGERPSAPPVGPTLPSLPSLGSALPGFSPEDRDAVLALGSMGSLAAATGFETLTVSKAASWWSAAIAQGGMFRSGAAVPERVTKALRTLEASARQAETIVAQPNGDFTDMAREVMGQILRLPEGESYCLAGGFAGENDQAMVYRFEKKAGGLFNVYLYNPQAGSSGAMGGRRVDNKQGVRPCYVFENVTCNDLFFCTPTTFGPNGEITSDNCRSAPVALTILRLLDLRKPRADGAPPYQLKDALSVLCRLRPRLVSGRKLQGKFTRALRSGNGAVKCVNCLLLDMLGDTPEGLQLYKKLTLDERLFGLTDYWRVLRPSFYSGQIQVRPSLRKLAMLRRAARNFLTILDKNFRRGLIDEPTYERAFREVNRILTEVKGVQESIRKRPLAPEAVPSARPAAVLVQEGQDRTAGIKQLARVSQVHPQEQHSFCVDAKLGFREPCANWLSVTAQLQQTLDAAQKGGADQAAISQFELTMGNLFSQISYSGSRIDGLSREDTLAVLQKLDACLGLYRVSVSKLGGTPSARVQNAGMQALALSFVLARSLGFDPAPGGAGGPPAAAQFGVYIEHFRRQSVAAIYAPKDSEAIVQRNAIIEFWDRVNAGTPPERCLFNFESQQIGPELVQADRIPELALYRRYAPVIERSGIEAIQPYYEGAHWYDGLPSPDKKMLGLFVASDGQKFPPEMAHLGALKSTALLAFALFSPGKEDQWGRSSVEPGTQGAPPSISYAAAGRSWRVCANPETDKDAPISFARLEGADFPGLERRRLDGYQAVDLPPGPFTDYAQDPQHAHARGAIRSANALLVAAKDGAVSDRDMALSVPEVQTSLLFSAIEGNLPRLSEPAWRLQVEAELFKTVEERGRIHSPLFAALIGERADALIGQLDRLTRESFRQFVEATPRDPKIKEMLFVLRLRSMILANLVQHSARPFSASTEALNNQLLQWLNDQDQLASLRLQAPDLTQPELERLSAQRCDLALAQAGLLLGMPKDSLYTPPPPPGGNLDRLALLFRLVMDINGDYAVYARNEETRPFLRECLHRFTTRRDIWGNLPQQVLAGLANKILQDCHIGYIPQPGAAWRFVPEGGSRLVLNQPPAPPPAAPPPPAYVIDLTRAAVLKNGAEVKRSTFQVTPGFKRLFGERQIEVHQENPEVVSFDDPRWGHIEIRGRDRDAQIWRLYQGRWYIHPWAAGDYDVQRFKSSFQINDALYFDHVHWIQPESGEVLIFGLQGGEEPVYRIVQERKPRLNPDGSQVTEYSQNEAGQWGRWPAFDVVSHLVDCREASREFCLLPAEFGAAVSRFEDTGQVNAWARSASGAQTEFTQLEFPRFRMRDSSLHFDWDGHNWCYAADSRFHISTAPSEPLLDTCSRYLHLVQEVPDAAGQMRVVKRKVLIPQGQIEAAGFEEYATIGLPAAADGNKAALGYFEYDYDEEKGKLEPVTLEGRLYLAHLYLAQKRYQEAQALLKKISMSAKPSAEAVQLLLGLLGSGAQLHDLSPSACAVRLYAYQIFKKIKPRDDQGVAISYETPAGDMTMAEVYKRYLFGLRTVERPLVFDPDSEWEIFQSLRLGDEFNWRQVDLCRERGQGAAFSPIAVQELAIPDGGLRPVWPDIKKFQPYSWPTVDENQSYVGLGGYSQLPYRGPYDKVKYPQFREMYETITRAQLPEQREMWAFYVLSSGDLYSSEQKDLLVFVAGHPDLFRSYESMPRDERDTAGWLAWCRKLSSLPHGYAVGVTISLPSLEFSLPEAAQLPPAQRELPQDMPPGPPALALAQPVPLANAQLEIQIAELQRRILESQAPRPPSPPRPKTPPPAGLTAREGVFGDGVATEIKRYQEDQDIARENEARQPVLRAAFRRSAAAPNSPLLGEIPALETQRGSAKREEAALRELVVSLANRLPDGMPAAIAEQVRREGEARPELDINTILRAAATSSEALRKLNQFLAPQDLEHLRSACLDYMVVVTNRQHIERLLKPLTDWRNELQAAERGNRAPRIDPQWEQDFVAALAQSRTYNPYDPEAQDYFPLLFEYMSGMRIWGNQASIIRLVLQTVVGNGDAAQQNIVFQRIMAGGKTSVIVSALLELISQSGQLPIVLCHHSQYASVSGNLPNFQESRYEKGVYAIDYKISQLGDPLIVDEMVGKVREADKKGCSLLMKSSMPQVIELKFVMSALRLPELREQLAANQQRERDLSAPLPPGSKPDVQAQRARDLVVCREEIARLQGELQCISKLAEVIKIFKSRGVGVSDECDIILSMLMEVNVPIGEEELLTPERAELVREIYGALLSDDPLQVPGQPLTTLRQFVDLEHNNQAKLSEADFNEVVAPAVARKLFEYPSLQLGGMAREPEVVEAFSRYVLDRIDPADQALADQKIGVLSVGLLDDDELVDRVQRLPSGTPQEGNVKFLCYLAALKRNSDRYKRDAADKIALSGRIVRDVLQLALSKSLGRSYGRDPAHDNGSVIPFLGVGAPAKTRFGYVYLALCYQFQAALNQEISAGELRYLAERLGTAAQEYAKKSHGETFDEQPEARWFFEVTGGQRGGGVRLSEALRSEEAMARACRQINADPRRKLAIEAEIAPFHVRYYKERVSSNPINLAEQMRKMFGCSGTPWNWHSYHRKFGELERDRGVEGRIMNTMLDRAGNSGKPYAVPSPYPPAPGQPPEQANIYQAVTELPDDGLQPILDRILQHPQRQRVRALTDAGGFLKGTNNDQAAQAILGLYARTEMLLPGGQRAIDAVIFHHLSTPAEIAAGKREEVFLILKRMPDGSTKTEELPDTSAASIANCGVPKERIFVLFDELRAAGTDIPLADDTICLETVDPRMPVRTLLQAALRPRRYFQGQDCEFLVTRRGRAEMLNRGATLQDIIDTLVKNQAIADGDQTFRSYLAQMVNVARSAAMQEMLAETDMARLAGVAAQYRSFLVSSFVDDPFAQFGRVEGPRPTLDILFNHAVNTLTAYYQRKLGLETIRPDGVYSVEQQAQLEAQARALRLRVEGLLFGALNIQGELAGVAARERELRTLPAGATALAEVDRLLGAPGAHNADVEAQIVSLLKDAQQRAAEGVLPATLRYRQGADIDAQVEVQREQEQEVAKEPEAVRQLDPRLQAELDEINKITGTQEYREQYFSLSMAQGAPLDLSGLRGRSIATVASICGMSGHGPMARFAQCFPPNLSMTGNLFATFEGQLLPLLHRKMKTAKFMLVVDDYPQPQFVLLSERDAAQFKSHIAAYNPSNAWLIDLKGDEDVTVPRRPLLRQGKSSSFITALDEALWMANFFNGNAEYLDSHRELTLHMMETHQDLQGFYRDFVAMRAARSGEGLAAALGSDFLRPAEETERQKTHGVVFSARRQKEQAFYERLRQTWGRGANWAGLEANLVGGLAPRQLQYLVNKAQILQVARKNFRYLTPGQAPLLHPKQVNALDGGVPAELDLLRAVRDPKVIQQLTNRDVIRFLDPEQIKMLLPAQLPLLSDDQIAVLAPEVIAKWPLDNPELGRLAMVRDERSIPVSSTQGQYLRANADAVFRRFGDNHGLVANWLIPHLRDRAVLQSLPTARIPQLVQGQVNLLLPGQAQYLLPQQVAWLTEPTLIANITHDALHVAQIPAGLVQHLDNQDINRLPADATKVKGLIDRQVNLLTDQRLIQLLDEQHVKMLTNAAVVRLLSPAQVNMLAVGQLPLLAPRQIDDLTDPVLIDALAPDQVRGHFVAPARHPYRQHISRQECMLQLDSDAGLTPDQKQALRAYIANPSSLPVQIVPSGPGLPSLASLSAPTLKTLPRWCNHDDYAWLRFWHLSRADFDALRPDQKDWIKGRVQLFNPQDLADIARCDKPQSLEYVSDHYLDMLSPTQLAGLDQRHVNLLMRMGGGKLKELTAESVLNLVPVGRLGELSDYQVRVISDPALINSGLGANRGFLRRLEPGQYNAVANVEALLELDNLEIEKLTQAKRDEISAYLARLPWTGPAVAVPAGQPPVLSGLKEILIERSWARPLARGPVLRLDSATFDQLWQSGGSAADRQVADFVIGVIRDMPVATIAVLFGRRQLEAHFLRFLTVGRPGQPGQLDSINVANPAEVALLNHLPPEQIKRLPEPQVKMLTDPAKIDQIQPSQVPMLDDLQIAHLRQPELVRAVAADKVWRLDPRVRHLIDDPAKLLWLPGTVGLLGDAATGIPMNPLMSANRAALETYISRLPIADPASFSLTNVGVHFAEYCWPKFRMLDDSQLRQLQQPQRDWIAAQVNTRLTDAELLTLLRNRQLSGACFGLLLDNRLGALVRQDQSLFQSLPVAVLERLLSVNAIAPDVVQMHGLSQVQLDSITVAEARLVNILLPAQVQQLKAPQVKMLTADLTSNRIDQILSTQVPMLDDGQIQHLRQPGLVQEVAADKVQFINPDSRQHIDDPAKLVRLPDARGLDANQLIATPAGRAALETYIRGLPTAELRTIGLHFAEYCWPAFQRLAAGDLAGLTDGQRGWILNRVRSLGYDELLALWGGGQLNDNYLSMLSDEQVRGLRAADRDLVNRLPQSRLRVINSRDVLQVVDKARQAQDFTGEQITTLYPRNVGLRVLALVGLIFSSLLVLPLLSLFSATVRDWWRLAGSGIRSEESYIATRRELLGR